MKRALFSAIAVGCLLALSSCGGKERLYIYNWTYYTPQSVIEKFQQEYNCEVIEDNFDSNEMMYNKIKAGGAAYDIVFPSCDYVSIMITQDMLEKIDKTKLSNLGNIDPALLERASYDPKMDYSIPYFWGAAGVCVNTKFIPTYEKSWSLFAREDLKGKLTMLDDMREVMGDALVFMGNSVNTKDAAEITAARDLIETQWKPNLARFDADSFAKNSATGSFWAVQGYPEGVYQEIEGNSELEANTVFFIPKEGGPAYIDSMCILKGAKNYELALKFIDFIHRPENYAEFCDTFRFPATVNVPARKLLKKKPMYEASELLRTELKLDLGEALYKYTDAWDNTIKVGG
jgi:spermidine/putrescine transport system substrate-binding protein